MWSTNKHNSMVASKLITPPLPPVGGCCAGQWSEGWWIEKAVYWFIVNVKESASSPTALLPIYWSAALMGLLCHGSDAAAWVGTEKGPVPLAGFEFLSTLRSSTALAVGFSTTVQTTGLQETCGICLPISCSLCPVKEVDGWIALVSEHQSCQWSKPVCLSCLKLMLLLSTWQHLLAWKSSM